MTRPTLSVILPFYQAAPWLEAAARSVLSDGFQDLELLLIDDGSRDGGLAIAEALAMEDARVRVFTGPNHGIVAALNHGLAEARAPLIARMDGDDLSLPGRFAAQLAFLDAHPEVAVVDGQVEIFRDDGPLAGGMAAFSDWLAALKDHASLRAQLFVDSPLVHPAVMARKDVLRGVGGYVHVGPEDYHLWLRVVAAGHHLHKLPRQVLRWRDHGARLTRTDPRYDRRSFWSVKWRFIQEIGGIRRGQRLAVWGAGKEARPWLRALKEERWEVTTVVDIDPRKQGTTRHGFPTFPVDALLSRPWDRCLVAVGARGAREDIGRRLAEAGIPLAPVGEERGAWFVA